MMNAKSSHPQPVLYLLIPLLWLVASGAALAQPATSGSQAGTPQATETGYIYVEEDVRLYYQRFGTGQPRIFIPNQGDMVPFLLPLLASHDVVAWDTRGRRLSDRPDDLSRYGLEIEIADAEAIRRHFGSERIIYVGGSLWGSIAAVYAARHPESVERAVSIAPLAIAASLQGPPDHPLNHDLTALDEDIAAMEQDGRHLSEPYDHCHLVLSRVFADSYVDLANLSGLDLLNPCQYRSERPDLFLPLLFEGYFPSLGDWDWRDEVAGVTQPLLVIYGDHEGAPLSSLRLYAELAQGGWIEVTDAAHHVWIERPDIVVPALDAFFRGQWPDGVRRDGREGSLLRQLVER